MDFALADQLFIRAAVGLAIEFSFLLFVLNPQRQAFNALGNINGGGGQAGEGL